MGSLKEEAKAYEPKQTKNIADLEQVPVELLVQTAKAEDKEGKTFEYRYVELNGEQYRVPPSVIAQLKEVLEARPDMLKFRVKKSGAGLNTKYNVVGL
jgi:hypothetical protein